MAKKQSTIDNRKSKIRWSFPTVSACPRCRGTQTRAVSTQGKVQYRKCLAPICRKRYTVIGQKVKRRTQNKGDRTQGSSSSSSSSSSSA